jgi:hypothetical protein
MKIKDGISIWDLFYAYERTLEEMGRMDERYRELRADEACLETRIIVALKKHGPISIGQTTYAFDADGIRCFKAKSASEIDQGEDPDEEPPEPLEPPPTCPTCGDEMRAFDTACGRCCDDETQ